MFANSELVSHFLAFSNHACLFPNEAFIYHPYPYSHSYNELRLLTFQFDILSRSYGPRLGYRFNCVFLPQNLRIPVGDTVRTLKDVYNDEVDSQHTWTILLVAVFILSIGAIGASIGLIGFKSISR